MIYDKPSMAEIARGKGIHPVELMIDMALERDLKMFFRQPIGKRRPNSSARYDEASRSVIMPFRFRCSCIANNGLPRYKPICSATGVREKQAMTLEEAIKQITYNAATMWGVYDRVCYVKVWRQTWLYLTQTP